MSRITTDGHRLTAEIHCSDPTCQKCAARLRWLRRKAWRTDKAHPRKNNNGRK